MSDQSQSNALENWILGRERGTSQGGLPQRRQRHGRLRGGSNGPPKRNQVSRAPRRTIALETQTVLPGIVNDIPGVYPCESLAIHLRTVPALDPLDCPGLPDTIVKVVNQDSFNAALELGNATSGRHKGKGAGRVAVLNMANPSVPGGGWLHGSLAQEEVLCYRSSLSMSLHPRYFPWKTNIGDPGGVYTKDVVIIREDMPSGDKLLVPAVKPADLPIVSVLSISAIQRPQYNTQRTGREVFSNQADRQLTKDKMRVCLRAAAANGNRLLVLSALGCGSFGNPTHDVATCWVEVLKDEEFRGGWWEEVWFAVLDTRKQGNFSIYYDTLNGLEI